eukprot:EG_transcript_2006
MKFPKTLFSVSQWLEGVMTTSAKQPGQTSGHIHCKCSETPVELLSCSELSSDGISEEASSGNLFATAWNEGASSVGSTHLAGWTGLQAPLPPFYTSCMARIREELQLVLDAFPPETPSSVVCHALGYILQTKWKWNVKFCCQVKDSKLPSAMPVAWLQDVMVVMPADRTHVLVDMQFREKFVLRCPGALGKKYMSHVLPSIPSVFIGPLSHLFREVDNLTVAIEKVFQSEAQTLPPWRSRRIFQLMYKHCVECDATESSEGLRRVGALLNEELVLDEAGCTGFGVEYLDNLRWALTRSQCTAAGELSPDATASEPIAYNFDKEETPSVSCDSDCSGLSFLLNSR